MILGIETATGSTGVALVDAGVAVADVSVRGDRRHAELLAPAITQLLELTGRSLDDIEAIALDVGPGLFTGLRVGVATAQGLGQGLGIGVLEATSLSVLARQAYDAGWQGPVVAVIDARRGEVFTASYDAATAEVVAPERCSPEALALRLVAGPGPSPDPSPGPCLLVGTGAHRYADLLACRDGLVLAHDICDPSARTLAELCSERLDGDRALARARLGSGGDEGTGVPAAKAPRDVRPLYLREADARIGWAQR